MPEADILIRHAFIIDGSGRPGFTGDIAVRSDRIAAVGSLPHWRAKRQVDAHGLYAAPGFIDPHGHSDLSLLADPRGLSKLAQGITTEACGQCGMSPFPVPAGNRDEFRALLAYAWAPVEIEWSDAAGYIDAAARQPLGINLCPFLGANTVVLWAQLSGQSPGSAPALSPHSLRPLWGISLGIAYEPLAHWAADDIALFAKAAAGKTVSVHMRNEGSRLLESIDEVVRIARDAGVRVEIAHLKASRQANWGKIADAIDAIERARRAGLDIAFNVYPYAAGSTFLAATLPDWLIANGHAEALRRLHNESARAKLRDDYARGRAISGLPPDRILVAGLGNPRFRWAEGMSLADIAQRMGVAPIDALIDLLLASDGQATAIFFTMCDEDVRRAICHPLASVCSDGLALCPDGPTSSGSPHPRCYGSHARFLGRMVRDEGLLEWPEAIRKCTSLPASRLGLPDRGILAPDYAADIVLFDPDRIIDTADYGDPHHLAEGVEYVLVNGVLAISDGRFTGDLGGRVLTANL